MSNFASRFLNIPRFELFGMLTPIGLTEMKPGFNLLIEIEIQKRKRMDGLGKPGFNYLIKIEI